MKEITEDEMSKMIKDIEVGESISFGFSPTRVTVKPNQPKAESLLNKIRDESELSKYHKVFEIGDL